MGCDIHWIFERKHPSKTWHAVNSSTDSWCIFEALKMPEKTRGNHPMYEVGSRNYARFMALSGVRGFNPTPLMTEGCPWDASDYTREQEERWGEDAHSWGWSLGQNILAWKDPRLDHWPKHINSMIDCIPMNECIFSRDGNRKKMGYSAHNALMKIKLQEELLPITDPTAWRMIIYYDN